MSHTPGPWAVKIGDAEQRSDSRVFQEEDEGFTIARVTCEARNPLQRVEDVANARLIAAAPELITACKMMLLTWGSDDEEAVIAARDAACAAIAKSEGKS